MLLSGDTITKIFQKIQTQPRYFYKKLFTTDTKTAT